MPLQSQQNTFGERLKFWRKHQGRSQLELALLADVSQRHISFLESGRAQPTEDMVLHLSRVLELEFRIQNLLLSAAGFAPLYTEHNLEAPEMLAVKQAIDFVLKQQEPYPAFVLDRHWSLLASNMGAQHLLAWFYPEGPPETLLFHGHLNIMKIMLSPLGLRPFISNFETVAYILLQRLQREALVGLNDPLSQDLYSQLKDHWDLKHAKISPHQGHAPVLSTRFSKDGEHLSLFSTIATLGTPTDITLQELRIESLFPADTQTRQWFEQLS